MAKTESTESPVELLDAAYKQLEFDQGTLLPAEHHPQPATQENWLETGDWQSLAAQVGAEKIFFVDRDPVVVFAKVEDASPEVLKKFYERVWCMSRPQLLFLASPGQLWGYAKRFPRGAMIGYWQNMDARQVLKEVNDEARKKSIPDLILVGNWKSKEVNHLEHTFERPFDISPFELRHLWIDLRHWRDKPTRQGGEGG